MRSLKRLRRQRLDQVLHRECTLTIGDKPVEDVVIVKSGEIPLEEGFFHQEL